MKRRLRKKKRVGEFRELGFEVRASLRAGLSEADFLAFFERWLDVVDARNLCFGGGGNARDAAFMGFVTTAARGSASEEDRAALAAFLASDAEVMRHEVLALRDAWYGWDEG